jgi:multiple sugar transport system ATP-binding protein
MEGRVYTVEPTGDLTFVHVKLGAYLLVASADSGFRAAPDSPLWIAFDQQHLHLFDAESEQLLDRAETPLRLPPREPAPV